MFMKLFHFIWAENSPLTQMHLAHNTYKRYSYSVRYLEFIFVFLHSFKWESNFYKPLDKLLLQWYEMIIKIILINQLNLKCIYLFASDWSLSGFSSFNSCLNLMGSCQNFGMHFSIGTLKLRLKRNIQLDICSIEMNASAETHQESISLPLRSQSNTT